jgi:guanylate kinase
MIRATESDEMIDIRLKTAEREMQYKDKPGFFHKIIINDSLEIAYKELKEFLSDIIQCDSKASPPNNNPTSNTIVNEQNAINTQQNNYKL